MECPYCREEINEGAIKCKHCGTSLETPQAEASVTAPAGSVAAPAGNKSRIATGLLAFFLGGFGIHKFYLGSWGWGIVYILLVWTYIPSIVALVEAIRFAFLSDEDFQRKIQEKDGPFAFYW